MVGKASSLAANPNPQCLGVLSLEKSEPHASKLGRAAKLKGQRDVALPDYLAKQNIWSLPTLDS